MQSIQYEATVQKPELSKNVDGPVYSKVQSKNTDGPVYSEVQSKNVAGPVYSEVQKPEVYKKFDNPLYNTVADQPQSSQAQNSSMEMVEYTDPRQFS